MVLSINFTTNKFYYVALSGEKSTPKLENKGEISLPVNHSIPQIVDWFEKELELLLDRIKPDKVCYKLVISKNIKNDYITKVYYGQAMLNLLCYKRNISITYITKWVEPSKLGLPKEANLIAHIDELLGKPSAPWNEDIKKVALMALINL